MSTGIDTSVIINIKKAASLSIKNSKAKIVSGKKGCNDIVVLFFNTINEMYRKNSSPKPPNIEDIFLEFLLLLNTMAITADTKSKHIPP